mmetsp:Transcript_4004/g.5264  ORF Transcript_4004/g.5264 Transcript_4004/m.5264 type:complete len:214 (-) Transcript_4004:15-656(-)
MEDQQERQLKLPDPPLDPIEVFQRYLDSIVMANEEGTSASPVVDGPPQRNVKKRQCPISDNVDHILRVVLSLFPGIAEGAMSILDSPSSITRVTSAHSRRSLFLVAAASSSSNSKAAQTQQQTLSSHYFCQLSSHMSPCGEGVDDPTFFCSCRSYLDKNNAVSPSSVEETSGFILCKHLLAILLVPVMGIQPSQLEMSSDQDFSELILSRIGL